MSSSFKSKPWEWLDREKLSRASTTVVFDVERVLLRSSRTFPYFMLVALEGGGFLRGLLLLLLYPLLCCLSVESGLRVMVMVSFCGLRKDKFMVGKAVLPKFLLEGVGLEGFEEVVRRVGRGRGRRVGVSAMPRVMVEVFLKEYLEVEVVVGRELKVFGGFFTGFMEEGEGERSGMDLKEVFGEEEGEGQAAGTSDSIGVSSPTSTSLRHPIFRLCKEVYLVDEAEKKRWHPLPRNYYPKPLIFHDGRIAFRPEPLDAAAMFMWLPISLPLAFLRLFIGLSLPYRASTPILSLTGMKWKLRGAKPPYSDKGSRRKAHIYVCNHRTLIDAIYISAALNKPITSLVYSLSRVSEFLSPIKTFRMTRNRDEDRKLMEKLLGNGCDVVVCPEGTTCREPYLLRFSPLFAEMANEVVPVAIDVRVSMFYATTAGGFKCLDPFYYLMNPSMCYELEFLGVIDTTCVRVGKQSSIDMANQVQELMGRALGFECTKLTRKDKYMILAGNDGSVPSSDKKI